MSELVSIARSDERFESYLKGTFAKDQRAIPQQTLRKGTPEEETVFRVFDLKDVERPSNVKVWWQTLRWPYLSLTVAPILATMALLLEKQWAIHWGLALSALLGAIFLQLAGHLFNDYSDHLQGWDRLQPSKGSRSIQKGWLAASDVQKTGVWFCVFGVLFGLPSLYAQPALMSVVGLSALVGVLEFSSNRLALKYRGLGEISLSILLGPLITLGWAVAATGRFDFDILAMGLIFGIASSYVYFLKNIEELLADSTRRHATLAVALGFDHAKLLATWGVWLIPLAIFAWAVWRDFSAPVLMAGVATVPMILRAFFQAKKVTSTFSSQLNQARILGLRLHFYTGFVLTLSLLLFALTSPQWLR